MLDLSLSWFSVSSWRPQGVIIVTLVFGLSSSATIYGQVSTTTQLSVSTASVAVGVPALLTATVTDAASHGVHLGTVIFYNGSRSLGSAQIVSGTSGAYPQGTANLKTDSFSLGANSITAVFAGTKADLQSTSSAKTVTVTGKNQTTASLQGYVTGTDFWLPATLTSFGAGTPTGDVDFVHISSGTTIGTKSLSGAKWRTDLTLASTTGVGKGPGGIAAGDFDGDGILDLATSNNGGKNLMNLSVLLGNGDGSFRLQTNHPVVGGYPSFVQAADFNNDGKLDLVVANDSISASGSPVGVLLGNGDGTFQAQVGYGSNLGAEYAYAADLDRDGNLDIVMLAYDSGGSEIGVLLGNGDGTFQAKANFPLDAIPDGMSVGDLNGDGIPDLVVAAWDQSSSDPNQSLVLLGKGDGTFQLSSHLTTGFTVALADVNHDGKLDAVITSDLNDVAGTISISLGKGDGTFESPQIYSISAIPLTPLVVDINQDGNPDITLTEQNFTDYVVEQSRVVFLGNGDGTFQRGVSYLPDLSIDGPRIAGDFNGDGRADLAETNGALNTMNVILSGQSTNLLLAKSELGPGTTTVQAKYSGDGNFAANVSNKVVLTPNGTPPPTFPNGFLDSKTGALTPAARALQFNGSALATSALGNGVLLTTGESSQAGSIFYGAPQNVQAFTTDFTFQIFGFNTADGLTFTIQNDGAQAFGGIGGGLGYTSISKSVAVKFDLYNNGGEGDNSTGLYTGGFNPTIPAVDLTASGIDLHTAGPGNGYGDAFDVHITYDGATLTLKITDESTSAVFSDSFPIDIPGTVGGTTAYVGFTGSTGGRVSTDQISTWTYVPGTP